MSEYKKYCEGLDCTICGEKEPCIYKIANKLQAQLQAKEQECEELKDENFSLRREGNKSCAYCIDYIEQEKQANRYKQALTEIEYITKELFLGVENKDRRYCEKILDIINKTKKEKVNYKEMNNIEKEE